MAAARPQPRAAGVLPRLAVPGGLQAAGPLSAQCLAPERRGAGSPAQLPPGSSFAHFQPFLQVSRPQRVDHHAAGSCWTLPCAPGGRTRPARQWRRPSQLQAHVQRIMGYSVSVVELVGRTGYAERVSGGDVSERVECVTRRWECTQLV